MGKVYTREGVQIERHEPDWNNLSAHVAVQVNQLVDTKGTGYHNPAFSVSPSDTVSEDVFFKHARRAFVLWTKQLNKVLGGNSARKRFLRSMSLVERRLEFTGIMVCKGVILDPKAWSNKPVSNGPESRASAR